MAKLFVVPHSELVKPALEQTLASVEMQRELDPGEPVPSVGDLLMVPIAGDYASSKVAERVFLYGQGGVSVVLGVVPRMG